MSSQSARIKIIRWTFEVSRAMTLEAIPEDSVLDTVHDVAMPIHEDGHTNQNSVLNAVAMKELLGHGQANEVVQDRPNELSAGDGNGEGRADEEDGPNAKDLLGDGKGQGKAMPQIDAHGVEVETFAGNPVFYEGSVFNHEDYGHALEIGFSLVGNQDGHRLLAAVRRVVDSPSETSKFAVIGYGEIALLLFSSQADAEYALASQLGLKAGILNKVWCHHPELPRNQAVVYTVIEVVAAPGDTGRAVHDEIHRLCGEVGFIRWRKCAVDDRTEKQREQDLDEEAELDLLAPRFPRTYEVYFRQSSGQRCAQQLEARRNKPAIFERGFKVYRIDHLRRPFLEKPLPSDPPTPMSGLASTAAATPGPSHPSAPDSSIALPVPSAIPAPGPSTNTAPGPSTITAGGPSLTSGPGPSQSSAPGPSTPSHLLSRRARRARRAPPIPDSVSVADTARLSVIGFPGVIRFTDVQYTAYNWIQALANGADEENRRRLLSLSRPPSRPQGTRRRRELVEDEDEPSANRPRRS